MNKPVKDLKYMLANTIFKELKMKEAMATMVYHPNTTLLPMVRGFIEKYAKLSFEDIDWVEFCDEEVVKKNPLNALRIVNYWLANNCYEGTYKEDLYRIYPLINMETCVRTIKKYLLCGEAVEYLYGTKAIIRSNPSTKWFFIKISNGFLRQAISQFYSTHRYDAIADFEGVEETIFGAFETISADVHCYEDLNAKTFWKQVKYIDDYCQESRNKKASAYSSIVNFYRWVISNNDGYDMLSNALNLNRGVLFSGNMVSLLVEGYYFSPPIMNDNLLEHQKICFVFNTNNFNSCAISDEMSLNIELEKIKSRVLRKAFLNHIISRINSGVTVVFNEKYSVHVLQFLEDLKAQPRYPNKSITNISKEDVYLLKNYIDGLQSGSSVKVTIKNWLRSFLRVSNDANILKCDRLVIDTLTHKDRRYENKSMVVPDKELKLIVDALKKDSETDSKAEVMLAIIYLLIETEFRISQICSLKLGSIKKGLKANEYVIESKTKTSKGKIVSSVITANTYRILKEIIDKTEPIRAKGCNQGISDYIFVYEQPCRAKFTMFKMTSDNFHTGLIKLCKKLKLSNVYGSSNFRDTHMTKSVEYAIRHDLSELHTKILSGHKSLQTTYNHYLNLELDDMLESTYGIIIGNNVENVDEKVVEDINATLLPDENDVENHCGKCVASVCNDTTSLPCLVCKNFITTINHEANFKKEIEAIERLIKAKVNASKRQPYVPMSHEIEDLQLKKSLYVTYLKAIFKKKEGVINANSCN